MQEQRRTGVVTGAEAGEGAVFGAGAGSEAVFGAGAEKRSDSARGSVWCRSGGRGSDIGAGAGEGARQVGGDETMIPPNYDPADGLSISFDKSALTLSRSMKTTSGNEHMVVLAFLPKKYLFPSQTRLQSGFLSPIFPAKINVDICSVM